MSDDVTHPTQPALPPRVKFALDFVTMAGGTVVHPPDADLTARVQTYAAWRLAVALEDAVAGRQSDADFLRHYAAEAADGPARDRLRRLADAIDTPDWLDVDRR